MLEMKLLIFVVLFVQNIVAQSNEEVKLSYNLSPSQVNLLTNNHASYIALSGPGMILSNTKTEFIVRFLASLRFDLKRELSKPNESIRPLMGLGTQIRFKKIIFTPAAFYFYNNKWEYAAGIGYTFGKK